MRCIVFLVLIGFAITPYLISNSFAICMINEDWSDAPCYSKRGENPSLNQMKRWWSQYYEFKGTEWMESKKQELIQAIQNGNLIEWQKEDPDRSHHNVYMHYFLIGDIPNEDGLFVEEYYGVRLLSPQQQSASGIPFSEIHCGIDLVLIQKYDGSPACVTEQTKQKLIDRGWTKDGSALSKINTGCMTIKQSKQVASFFRTPTYLPEGYSHVCSRSGMPFESYIVYYNQEFPNNWQIPELVNEGAIFIHQIDERNFVGDKEFQTYGSPKQRIQETYDDIMKNNPSLNPQLITINGMLAYAVDSCPDCGIQTANFSDGTMIQKSTSIETKIKFIDDNGVSYMLETTLPLQELIKVAESLQ